MDEQRREKTLVFHALHHAVPPENEKGVKKRPQGMRIN